METARRLHLGIKDWSLPFVDEDSGITISPTLDELRDLVKKRGPEALTCIENFSVTDKEFGKVEWLEPVDVSKLDIARVVKFEKACLCLYPEDAGVEAPETGEGLKKRAMVTLTGVKPRKGTAAAKKRYEEKIENQTKSAGGELVSYDADIGEWKFFSPTVMRKLDRHYTTQKARYVGGRLMSAVE